MIFQRMIGLGGILGEDLVNCVYFDGGSTGMKTVLSKIKDFVKT